MRNPISILIGIYRTWYKSRTRELRLEFVVTDYCNLNCVGCTHYSPLAKKEFEPLDMLERNMAHLAKVCQGKIKRLYLIGGETLLYPDLKPAMNMLRHYFPDGELYIFTNGLMLPKMDDEFWQMSRDLGFIIALTRYPIKFDYDAVEDLCRRQNVRHIVFDDRSMANSFFKFALDPEKKQNGRLSHFKCYNRGCLSVVGDRLYPCSISACVDHLNKAHGTKFEHCKGDWLEVSEITDVSQIKRLRDTKVPFCDYCVYPITSVKYAPSKRERSEWVK
ncbi:MAG: radical SAM protein [Bacteroidales bacterium]|nr:radical SAM protein [Bacteroidales bacterium]